MLLILPCNAAACIGNYFRAETYTKKGWNTWREADFCLNDLRTEGKVALAAVDSSVLETEPNGSKGAIVFETEMHRVKNPSGEDWGAPKWRWFRPTADGKCEYLEMLTESLVKGVHRIEKMGFSQVFALVNPRGYFLSLAAALDRCRLLNKWILFRVPSHPRYLLHAVRQIAPLVRASAAGKTLKGGIYPIPNLCSDMQEKRKISKDSLPKLWHRHDQPLEVEKIMVRWLRFGVTLKRSKS